MWIEAMIWRLRSAMLIHVWGFRSPAVLDLGPVRSPGVLEVLGVSERIVPYSDSHNLDQFVDMSVA